MTAVSSKTSTRSKVGTALVAIAALAGVGGLSFAVIRLVVDDNQFDITESFTQSSIDDFDNPSESTFSLVNTDTSLGVKDGYLFLKTLSGYGTEETLSFGESPFRSNMSSRDNFLRDPAQAVTICEENERASIDSVHTGLFLGPEFDEASPDFQEANNGPIQITLPPLHEELFEGWDEENPLLDVTPGGRGWTGHYAWWETRDSAQAQTMSHRHRSFDLDGNPIYDRRVAFTSSNPEVALVYPNGAIFPIGAGTTRIAVNVCGTVSPEYIDVVVQTFDEAENIAELGGRQITPLTGIRAMDTRFIMGRLISDNLFSENISIPEDEVITQVDISSQNLADIDIANLEGILPNPSDYGMYDDTNNPRGFIRLYASANGGANWSLPINITPRVNINANIIETIEFAPEHQGTELLYALEFVHDEKTARIQPGNILDDESPVPDGESPISYAPTQDTLEHFSMRQHLRSLFTLPIAFARDVPTYFNSARTEEDLAENTSILPLYALQKHNETEGFPNIGSIPSDAGIFTAVKEFTTLVGIGALQRHSTDDTLNQLFQLTNPAAGTDEQTFQFGSTPPDVQVSNPANQVSVVLTEFWQTDDTLPAWAQRGGEIFRTLDILGTDIGFSSISCIDVPAQPVCPSYNTDYLDQNGVATDRTVQTLDNRFVATLPIPSIHLSALTVSPHTETPENPPANPGNIGDDPFEIPDVGPIDIPGGGVPGGGGVVGPDILPPGGPVVFDGPVAQPNANDVQTCADKLADQVANGVPENQQVICLNPADLAGTTIDDLTIEDREFLAVIDRTLFFNHRGISGSQRVVVPVSVDDFNDPTLKQLLTENAVPGRAFGDLTLLYRRGNGGDWIEAPLYPNPQSLTENNLFLTAALTDLEQGLRWNSSNGGDMVNGQVRYDLGLHISSDPGSFTSNRLLSYNRLQLIAYNYTLLFNDDRPAAPLSFDQARQTRTSAQYDFWDRLSNEPYAPIPDEAPEFRVEMQSRARGITFFNGDRDADPNSLGNDITLETLKFAQILDRRFQEFPQLLDTIRDEQGTEAAVQHIYKSVLDRIYPGEYTHERICDPAGCAYWAEQIDSGTLTPMGVTGAFLKSPEFIAPIRNAAADPLRFDAEYLYVLIFKRGADGAGVDWLVDTFGNDADPVASFRRHMLLSPEFLDRMRDVEAQSGRQSVVEEMYDACAEGPADQAGVAFWSQQAISLEDLRAAICADHLS